MATPVPAPPIDTAADLTDLIRDGLARYFARYADWAAARGGDRARGTPEQLWTFVDSAHTNLATLVQHAETVHKANVLLTTTTPPPVQRKAGR